MTLKGSFRINGFGKNSKYLWQYRRLNDASGVFIHHVIRPLFEAKCGTRYWECETRGKNPKHTLILANGDTICINTITRRGISLSIEVIWSQTVSGIWSSIKDTPLGKIMDGIENSDKRDAVLKNMATNLDEELDNAVIFCQKLATGIQLLQERLGESSDIIDIFPKGTVIQRKITYEGLPD